MPVDDSFPDKILTTPAAEALGYSRQQLAAAVDNGVLRRCMRGVYVPSGWPDDLEHRARAAAAVLGAGRVFVDRTAAWLHGIDVLGFAERENLPSIETAVLTRRRANRALGVRGRTRDLAERDVMLAHGVRVTTPIRTALDLACNLRRADAMGALDAFARQHDVSQVALLAELPRFKGRRGVVQARQLISMLDARAESARESQLRLAIKDAGLPSPAPQHVVIVSGQEFRLDFAYPAHRVAIEYDGEQFHNSGEQRMHDQRRRELLADAGWTVIVVRRGDFVGVRLDAWLSELQSALEGRFTSLRW